jgi:hypothetical protein
MEGGDLILKLLHYCHTHTNPNTTNTAHKRSVVPLLFLIQPGQQKAVSFEHVMYKALPVNQPLSQAI